MPKTSKAVRSSSGPDLERRVGRLFFWTGFFSRTGIDLKEFFRADALMLTDLDLLAYQFTELLTVEKVIGETKTGTGRSAPKPLDRTFWLAGVKEFTGADSAVLVVSRGISPEIRKVADRLGVRVIATDELASLEAAAGSTKLDYGSFADEFAGLWVDLRDDAKRETVLDRAWKFLRADAWHLDPWTALKRSMSLLALVSRNWPDQSTPDRPTLVRALLVEGTVVFSWAAIQVAGLLRWLPSVEQADLLGERLSEGLAPREQLEKLAEGVDRYVMSLLHEVGAPDSVKVQALGAFAPRPPDWADAFAELMTRLAQQPRHSRSLPRLLDVALYENVLGGRVVEADAISGLNLDDAHQSFRLARLVARFLQAHASVPPELYVGLGFSVEENSGEETVEQQLLIAETGDLPEAQSRADE